MESCIFCNWQDSDERVILAQNDVAYARLDNFPVSPGHALIVPKRHVVSFFDLTRAEALAIVELMHEVRHMSRSGLATLWPDGYNIGINEGEAAGRTVHHMHLHIIPRYKGDVPNPSGGIRNILDLFKLTAYTGSLRRPFYFTSLPLFE